MTNIDFDELFAGCSRLKVAVIGDVMLDTYWWGSVERISPEAPVPVVALSRKEQRIGGAGNVALNLCAFGARTAVITVVGDDDEGIQLRQLLQERRIDTGGIHASARRVTTNKIRIISRNQQMMRLDAEQTADLDAGDEAFLAGRISQYLLFEKPDVVILEDYNKGVLTENIISGTIARCNELGIITMVDPKRKNFFAYKNTTLFKPNLHEVFTSLNMIPVPVSPGLLSRAHEQLRAQLGHAISLITLAEQGIFYQEGSHSGIIPSHRRNIADVSGAGDTVIAVAALVYAASRDIALTAAVANLAGGLVCEEVGTAAIDPEKLLLECKQLITGTL